MYISRNPASGENIKHPSSLNVTLAWVQIAAETGQTVKEVKQRLEENVQVRILCNKL